MWQTTVISYPSVSYPSAFSVVADLLGTEFDAQHKRTYRKVKRLFNVL